MIQNQSGASTGLGGSAAAAGSAGPDTVVTGFSSSAPGGKAREELLDSFSVPGGSFNPVLEPLEYSLALPALPMGTKSMLITSAGLVAI